ncbi:mediator complex, subunit Med21 [Coniella lustricola]|uniref:Mediator of RNA polymerase II transcription subunit 21 n=1 Tax=Coniella lustricola TaxID=2025994 RepID=A0A2T3AKF5_9PEZI|nr:mediator complex, subunit Med21 [Coniella lustricola]
MGDRLTQLQDAVDQLAKQFVACIHFLHRHHNRAVLGPNDKIQDVKAEMDGKEVDPLPDDEFRAGQLELARDLITKVQEIELIISTLPGLENNAQDQERYIQELEEEIRVAEAQRKEAIREMKVVKERLDHVVRGATRP